MAQSIKFGSNTFLDITGVADGANSRMFYEEGTWTPHLYDYETKIMNLGTAYYTRIGRFVFYCYSQGNFTPSSAISTMMQIRNFPFTGNIWGGGIYIGNIAGTAGDKTVQATSNAMYIRPNLTLNANTNYGAFTFWAFGIVS